MGQGLEIAGIDCTGDLDGLGFSNCATISMAGFDV